MGILGLFLAIETKAREVSATNLDPWISGTIQIVPVLFFVTFIIMLIAQRTVFQKK